MSEDDFPFRYNITAFPDTRVRKVFQWSADGVLVDFTGWTGSLRIGQNGVYLMTVSGAVTLGGAAGTATVVIPAGTITTPGVYWYVVDLTDPSSNPMHFVNGELRVRSVFP